MLWGGNTARTPPSLGTAACVACSELPDRLRARGHDPSLLTTRLSSETRSRPAACPWQNGHFWSWAFRGVPWEGRKAFFQRRNPSLNSPKDFPKPRIYLNVLPPPFSPSRVASLHRQPVAVIRDPSLVLASIKKTPRASSGGASFCLDFQSSSVLIYYCYFVVVVVLLLLLLLLFYI